MKNGMTALGILMIGLITIGIVNVINDYTSGSELDYYALKSVTEAAMLDSTDVDFYRVYGLYRMDREMFAESFLRRFSNAVKVKDYTINMYDINEVPPKVSVEVLTTTSQRFSINENDAGTLEISNSIDAVIESSNTVNILDDAMAGHLNELTEAINSDTRHELICK